MPEFVRGWGEEPDEPEDGFDAAQVCPNGHVANPAMKLMPEFSQKFCQNCGELTIHACPACQAEIRGYYRGSMSTAPYVPPRFCHNCGKPYPWTTRKLEAAKAYAQSLEGLNPQERVELALTIDEMVKDTPMAQVSASKFKNLVVKAAGEAPRFFRDMMVDVVSESVKKAIWGPAADPPRRHR